MLATYNSLVGLAVGGKYEVRRVLGAGGMGVVCEAIHLDLGKRVAVKLIDKSMKESELIVTRFRREARAAGQIASEHIVDVFDVGADPRVGLYMVMEYLVGEDLQTRLEREGRLDVKTTVMVAHQIARALAKAHGAGVIHRDLKPANVYLTQRDNGQMLVKLLDFGVSKLLNEGTESARITGTGTPIGTPLYMSPEQAEGKDDVDGRADIWSLGAVLYESLAGTPPFADRGGYHATIIGILTSRPKLLHDAAPWVPQPLAEVVDGMLVHDRDARIKDADSVTRRLLDAFPTVLPDGTGKHTAVIVTQTAAIDTTGDTEFFTGQVPAATSSRPAPSSGGTSSNPLPFSSDSNRPAPSSDAARTATATPVEMGARVHAADQTPRSNPKTAPLMQPLSTPRGADGTPLPVPSSSATGVSLPGTPPMIDPVPASELAPETERDEVLARRADQRRRITFALTVALLACVAIASFLAGRRVQSGAPPAAATLPTAAATDAGVP